eukprot:15466372-Alexandrium_andersonii.AAC.1
MGLLEVAPEPNIKTDPNINHYANIKTDSNISMPGGNPPSSSRVRARPGVGGPGKPASAGVA